MAACASGGVNSCRLVCEFMLRASRSLSFIVNDFSRWGNPYFCLLNTIILSCYCTLAQGAGVVDDLAPFVI